MTNDNDAILDDLLCRWHTWRKVYTGARGWSGAGPVFRSAVTSRQYDDTNGAQDEDIEASVMVQVDFEVGELQPLHYIAICVSARALSLGCAVFTNPRLPADREERDALVFAARCALLRRLLTAGVV